MAIKTSAIKHIELLKIYLDECPDAESIKKRLDSIDARLNIKLGDEGCATRSSALTEVSFMVKNKKRIIEATGEERFFGVFNKAVGFLEKNPDPSKKKLKKGLKKKIGTSSMTGDSAGGVGTISNAMDEFMSTFDNDLNRIFGEFAHRPLPEGTTAPVVIGDIQTPMIGVDGMITNADRLLRALEAGQYDIAIPGDRVDGTTNDTNEDRG